MGFHRPKIETSTWRRLNARRQSTDESLEDVIIRMLDATEGEIDEPLVADGGVPNDGRPHDDWPDGKQVVLERRLGQNDLIHRYDPGRDEAECGGQGRGAQTQVIIRDVRDRRDISVYDDCDECFGE